MLSKLTKDVLCLNNVVIKNCSSSNYGDVHITFSIDHLGKIHIYFDASCIGSENQSYKEITNNISS